MKLSNVSDAIIVSVESRKNGEDTIRRSKLNLVDLAGSERGNRSLRMYAVCGQHIFGVTSTHYDQPVPSMSQPDTMQCTQ